MAKRTTPKKPTARRKPASRAATSAKPVRAALKRAKPSTKVKTALRRKSRARPRAAATRPRPPAQTAPTELYAMLVDLMLVDLMLPWAAASPRVRDAIQEAVGSSGALLQTLRDPGVAAMLLAPALVRAAAVAGCSDPTFELRAEPDRALLVASLSVGLARRVEFAGQAPAFELLLIDRTDHPVGILRESVVLPPLPSWTELGSQAETHVGGGADKGFAMADAARPFVAWAANTAVAACELAVHGAEGLDRARSIVGTSSRAPASEGDAALAAAVL
jgi:hypothetical protein